LAIANDTEFGLGACGPATPTDAYHMGRAIKTGVVMVQLLPPVPRPRLSAATKSGGRETQRDD
jgi:hypothetical protein